MKRNFAIFFLLSLMFAQVDAVPYEEAHISLSKNFAEVAKKTVPAAVSIQVLRPGKGRLSPFEDRDFGGFFGDEFLRRFFDAPENKRRSPDIGQASGFLISADGYILTNSHVVADATEVTVTLNDGTTEEAEVIGQDPTTDIALIKIKGEGYPYLKLSDSDKIEVGEWVIAVGNPFGLQATVTVGIVSAKGRNNLDLASVEDFIQTDAAINQGNSGGPLLDLQGDVIGVNTAIVTNMSSGGYLGIGFAVPSNLAKHVMEQLRSSGTVKRGYLGIVLQEINQNLATSFGMKKIEGALVADVAASSPAEKAGIKQGDVVMSFNGRPVKNIGALRTDVAIISPGTAIKLTVLREGKEHELALEVGTFPEKEVAPPAPVSKIGFTVENLNPDLMKKFKLNEEKGVVVTQVKEGTPASLGGLKPGALILSFNNKPVESAEEFYRAAGETEKGKPILILVRQQDGIRFLSFKLPD